MQKAALHSGGTGSRHTALSSPPSPDMRELAGYVADMLHSLRSYATAPEFRALRAMLEPAEREAQKLSAAPN